jgi:hypothetical protein
MSGVSAVAAVAAAAVANSFRRVKSIMSSPFFIAGLQTGALSAKHRSLNYIPNCAARNSHIGGGTGIR